MPKWLKLIVAVLLLPFCAGGLEAFGQVIRSTRGSDRAWAGLLAGAGCWWGIYLLLPKPMWVYVFGHELTHAIWTWAMGGKVKKFKASSKGGHVVVTRTNFIITLAPYFFPLYAFLVAGAYLVIRLFGNPAPFAVWFHLLLGAAYAFHVTLTWHVLKSTQTDITSQGYLFSGVVILLGNLAVLFLAVPLLTGQVTVANAFFWWGESTVRFLKQISPAA